MDSKSKIKILQISNTIFFVIMIVVNALANTLPINNQTTGEIADKYPNLFVPAGITFAIWGVIYTMLAGFILYQLGLFTKDDQSHEQIVEKLGWLFVVSCIANSLWIFLWHYDQVYLSVAVMVVLLVTLIFINQTYINTDLDKKQKWLYAIPFSTYFGWITVATIANITSALVYAGWDGFGIPEPVWAIIMISIASLITITYLTKSKDAVFALVIIWAFIGIIIKHLTEFNGDYPGVIAAAAVNIVLIILAIILLFRMKRR